MTKAGQEMVSQPEFYWSWSMTGSDTHFAEYKHRAVDFFVQPSPLLCAAKYNMVLLQTKELTLHPIPDQKLEEENNCSTLILISVQLRSSTKEDSVY